MALYYALLYAKYTAEAMLTFLYGIQYHLLS